MDAVVRPVYVFLSLLPFVVSFLRDWQRYVLFGAPRVLSEAAHRRRAKRLTAKFAELGPAFIKGAQVLSTREDILPKVYTDELKTLQDKVPPFAPKQALAVIRQNLGRPAKEIFDAFEMEPLAAASLGQVHRAVYKGTPVAVKILRPRIERDVELDLRVVAFLIRLVYFFVDSHFVRSFWAIHLEYTRMIRQEMDFRNEEKHAAIFRRNFRDDPHVSVPECFTELTSRRTVVFEFVEGGRVDDPRALAAAGLTPSALIERLIEAYVRMTVVHGFIHADPHPGNLLVDHDGRVVLLDYGMALEFPDETRLEMLRACLCFVRGDIDGIVDVFYRLKIVGPEVNRALVRDAAETLLKIQLREDFSPRMVQEIADDILATFHRFPLRMPQQLVYLFRASALVEGLGMRYDEHFSGIREATPVIKRLIREVALEPKLGVAEQVKSRVRAATDTVRYLHRIVTRLEREEQRFRMDARDVSVFEGLARVLIVRLLIGLASIGAWLYSGLIYLRTDSVLLLLAMSLPAFLVFILCITLPVRRRGRL